jgi:glycosyltransferase involved in cell wall biosynthesis
MRIGIIHQSYDSKIPSGENLTVESIIKNQRLHGEVATWLASGDDGSWQKLSQWKLLFRHLVYDYKRNEFEKWLESIDLLQIHNTFPILTRANLRSIRKFGKFFPVLRVVHNYRTSCLKGSHFRKDQACNMCSRTSFIKGVIHSCYRSSFFLSIIVAKHSLRLNKVMTSPGKFTYVAVSESIKDYLKDNLPMGVKVEVVSNRIVDNHTTILPDASEVLLIGRLEPEKDVVKFLNVWTELISLNVNLPRLNIVGIGSQYEEVRKCAEEFPEKIIVHGYLSGIPLNQVIRMCKIFVFTSAWNEPFGRTIVEAASSGMFLIGKVNPILESLITPNLNGAILNEEYSNLGECISAGMNVESAIHIQESRRKFMDKYSMSAKGFDYSDLYSSYFN